MANINPNPNSTSIQFILNGNAFLYGSTGFKMLGYLYDSNPGYLINRSIGYFKAQLAFRGYSNRGHNIEALKVRLRGAGNAMDERVMSLGDDMKRQWEDGAEQAARGNQREAVPNLELAKNDPVQFLRTWFFHENESPDHNAQVVIFPEQYRAGSMNWMKASQQIIGGYPQLMSMPVHDQGEMLEIVDWRVDVEAASEEIDARQWHKNEDVGAMFRERIAFQAQNPELRREPRRT